MDGPAKVLHRWRVFLVWGSLAVFASAVVLRLGLGATPYDTTDSAGRPMGFNDPLHAEHYLIMIRHFEPADFLKAGRAYEWLLLAAHFAGAWLLVHPRRISPRWVRRYFFAQAVIFPFGILALPILPLLVAGFVTGMDREGFIDIPFIVIATHPVWVVASWGIAFRHSNGCMPAGN
jgi:hypothetical protein